MYQKKLKKEGKVCVTAGSLEPFIGKAANGIGKGGMEDVGAQRDSQGTKDMGPERSYHDRVRRWDGVTECTLWKKPEVKAKEILMRIAVTDRVTGIIAEQQAFFACLQNRVQYHERVPALCHTPVSRNGTRKDTKDRAAISGSTSEHSS